MRVSGLRGKGQREEEREEESRETHLILRTLLPSRPLLRICHRRRIVLRKVERHTSHILAQRFGQVAENGARKTGVRSESGEFVLRQERDEYNREGEGKGRKRTSPLSPGSSPNRIKSYSFAHKSASGNSSNASTAVTLLLVG
jgi:hypothetical protein